MNASERYSGLFAGLAIFIACLGLLGLSAYNVIQRTRSASAKSSGPQTNHLLVILSRDFPPCSSALPSIAVPITWWTMDNWLQEFAYRIHIGWWIFAIAGVLAFRSRL